MSCCFRVMGWEDICCEVGERSLRRLSGGGCSWGRGAAEMRFSPAGGLENWDRFEQQDAWKDFEIGVQCQIFHKPTLYSTVHQTCTEEKMSLQEFLSFQ